MSDYLKKPWLKFYDDGVPESIPFTQDTLVDIFDHATRDFSKKVAFVSQGYDMTYAELEDQVNRFASCLDDFDIRKGDSVSIHLPNVLQCVIAYFAILKIGAKAVMNNPMYSPPELEHQFKDSQSRVIITLDLFSSTIINLRPKTKIKQIICVALTDYLPPTTDPATILSVPPEKTEDVYLWKDLMATYSPTPPQVKVTMDDIAQLQYTGGTTGVSKGAMLTHGNLSRQLQQMSSWDTETQRGDNKVMVGALPFFHVYGLSAVMNLSIYYGFKTILTGRPTPDVLIDIIKTYRPHVACLVPTMYIGMLNDPNFDSLDMSCIERLMSGSAPLPLEVIKAYEERSGARINEGFGLTEASPVTHSNPYKTVQKTGSIGIPYPNTDVRLVDLMEGLTDVPQGEQGEMIIRGPQVMTGYWNRPDETAKTLRDGWLYTGDIATMDKDGYFYIVDRKKDMIISGGYNIYPRDIDEALYEHPSVLEACAIGVPHPTRGEQIKAFVVLKEGETASEKELVDFCSGRLAKYKLPTMIEFRTELPKSTVGKILRKTLRQEEKTNPS
ncbi:MAG: long-chain fatty acid--CoA ligase [Proteobacteria bacterium]|nr:long-chain fatty acid--CoA ligase [Pseudomonadota bacterium]